MRPIDFRRSAGFTLYELMLVVAIAAVIFGLAIPNMRQFVWNNRMTGTANDLLGAVYRARSESVKRHTQTVLCFTSNSEAAVPACDGDGSQGWVAFADTDNDGQADAGEEVVLRHGAIPDTITLISKPDDNAGYLAFNTAGFARDIALGTDLGGVVLCDKRGNVAIGSNAYSAARGVLISPTGRPRVTRDVDTINNDANLGGCP
jgi:type IV fimbrial biogenesis protein FimT